MVLMVDCRGNTCQGKAVLKDFVSLKFVQYICSRFPFLSRFFLYTY